MRDIEVAIEQDNIKNQNLKNVQRAEKELRDIRDVHEKELLKSATTSQKESLEWTKDTSNSITT